MTEIVHTLQEQHRHTLERLEQGEADDLFLDSIWALLDDLRQAGELVADTSERAQLRALIHFWSGTLFEYTGAYPTVTLLPADASTDAVANREPARSPTPLLWLLVGGASVAVIAAALVIIGLVGRISSAKPLAAVAPPAAMGVRYAVAEEGLGGASTPLTGPIRFCQSASDLVFHFGLAGYHPGADLRWTLRRQGVELTTRPAVPYGNQNESLTVRLASETGAAFQSGEYDLVLSSGGETIWVEAFEVLDVAPRAFGLRVSDVPRSPAVGDGRQEFQPGLRVLYLSYGHQGMCGGLSVSHELRLDGALVQRVDQVWQGPARGDAQVFFQTEGGAVFGPGEYEIVTLIGGAEQARVEFTILG